MVMFFFSSRRRHTRWNCDWSSDVCSSDLGAVAVQVAIGVALGFVTYILFAAVEAAGSVIDLFGGFSLAQARSEERRVGKGWRARWARDRSKRKSSEYE